MPLEFIYRRLRPMRIFEGPSEVHRRCIGGLLPGPCCAIKRDTKINEMMNETRNKKMNEMMNETTNNRNESRACAVGRRGLWWGPSLTGLDWPGLAC